MSEFDDLFADVDAELGSIESMQKEQLGLSLSAGTKSNPQQAANVYQLANKHRVPVDYAKRNQEKLERENYDVSNIPPVLSRFLSEKKGAEIAHDDISNLEKWESTFKEKNKGFFSRRWDDTKRGFARARGSVDTLNIESASSDIEFMDFIDKNEFGSYEEFVIAAANEGLNVAKASGVEKAYLTGDGQVRAQLREGRSAFLLDEIKDFTERNKDVKEIPHSPAMEKFNKAKGFSGGFDAFLESPLEVATSLTTESLVQYLPAVPFMAFGAGPAAMAGGTVSFANEYANDLVSSMTKAGIDLESEEAILNAFSDPEQLAQWQEHAMKRGVPIAVIDALSAGIAGKLFAISKTAKTKVAAAGAEGLVVQPGLGGLGEVAGSVSAGDKIDGKNVLAEMLGELAPGSVEVAMGVRNARKSEMENAQYEADLIEEISKLDSELMTRSPEDFMDHINQLQEEYDGIDAVYLDTEQARELFQDLEQDAAYEIIAEQIDEAEQLGTDIVIPIDQFAAKVAKSNNFASLQPHLKLSPEGATDSASLLVEAMKNVEADTRAKGIYNEVAAQLISTGRMTPEQARISAEIVPAYITTKAERTGKSIDEIYEMMGLKIVGPKVDLGNQGTTLLNQAKESGYEGNDIQEADEWSRAYEKFGAEGMTHEARMARAKDMGFDTDRVLYHGTDAEFNEFSPSSRGKLGPGVYLSKTEGDTKKYGDNLLQVYLSGSVASMADRDKASNSARGDKAATNSILAQEGYSGLNIDNEIVVFDPKNIRSVNAAFDPEYKDSSKLLAQSGVTDRAQSKLSHTTLSTGQPAWSNESGVKIVGRKKLAVPESDLDPSNELKLGHLAYVEDGAEVWTVKIYDGESPIGDATVQVVGGAITAIHDVEATTKKKGSGEKIVSSILASSEGPVSIVEAIPEAQGFWEKMGGYIDGNGNAKIQWADYEQSRAGRSRQASEVDSGSESLAGSVQAGTGDGSAKSGDGVYSPEELDFFESYANKKFPPKDLSQENRGKISLFPKSAVIQLGESSDLSTFLHEAGHLFLEMEGKLYQKGDPDGDAILSWLGAESFDSITTEQHEQWARGMEKYFAEGKAPSIELQSAFRRFAAWLKRVYRQLSRLNVELNDDIRAVMDRLLATDEQIDRIKNNFKPMFETADEAGMTKAEFDIYSSNASPDSAKETLQAKILKQLRRHSTQWWKSELSSKRDAIAKELSKKPVYATIDYIRTGEPVEGYETTKLDKGEVQAVLGSVPSSMRGMTADGGIASDTLAAYMGYPSGTEMLNDIKDSPSLKDESLRLAKLKMVEEHGDMLNDGTIEEQAERAMRDAERAKKLLAELRALSRKTRTPPIDRESLKEFAKETIAKIPYQKIRPVTYRSAEVRAAKKAVEAKLSGNMQDAKNFKIQELANYYLGKEATTVKEKSERIRSQLKSIQTKKFSPSKFDNKFVNQAKVLIAAYDFRKNSKDSTDLSRARIESVRNWIESQQQDPDTVSTFIQADILNRLIQYNEMTFEDIQGLKDTVDSIIHGSKLNAESERAQYQEDMKAGVESIIENRIETYETEMDNDIPWVKRKNTIKAASASLRKLESFARQADGMNEQGWVWKHTVKPLLDAANTALKMRNESGTKLNELFHDYNGVFNGRKDIQSFKLSSGQVIRMSYGSRISLALNLGNEGNYEALRTMNGKPLTDQDINDIVGTLNEKDWDLIQNVWDYIDTFFPQIAELEIKRSGVAPQKVKPRAFKTPSGREMKGGYYPLKGDPVDLKQSDQDIDTRAGKMMNGGAAAKSTKSGSTIERVGFGGKKIDFSINVLFNHIDEIIHDISHWEAVRNVDRTLKNEKVNTELSKSLGNEGVKAMRQRLKEVAAGPDHVSGLGWVDRILRHARLAATYSALGYSVRTALVNTMGLTTAIAEMDARSISAGTIEYYSNLKSNNDLILSKSEYMNERGRVLNRDIAYIRANLRGDSKFTKFKDQAFWLMTQTDKAITRPIWLAAYRQGETMFDTEQEAIDHADRMVARTQGSGMDMDLANVETRSELMKNFTIMYSAFSAIYNIFTEQVKRRKAGKISNTDLALRLTWLTIVPGFITALMTMKDSESEDPEKAAKQIGWEIAGQALGMIPIARDALSAAKYGSTFPSPVVQLAIQPFELARQVGQGEMDKALVRSATGMASWAHVPGGAQLNRSAGYLIDLQDNEVDTFSVYEFVVTGKE